MKRFVNYEHVNFSQDKIEKNQLSIFHLNEKPPWLLVNGKDTPEELLKTLTPNWDADTWEKYLEWYETQLGESQVHPRKYDKICEEQEESIFVNAQSSADDDLKAAINALIQDLTNLELKVVKLIFWESKSQRDAADILNISRRTVRDAKKRALDRIKRHFKGHTPISPIMKGKNYFPSATTGVNDGVFKLVKKHVPKAS